MVNLVSTTETSSVHVRTRITHVKRQVRSTVHSVEWRGSEYPRTCMYVQYSTVHPSYTQVCFWRRDQTSLVSLLPPFLWNLSHPVPGTPPCDAPNHSISPPLTPPSFDPFYTSYHPSIGLIRPAIGIERESQLQLPCDDNGSTYRGRDRPRSLHRTLCGSRRRHVARFVGWEFPGPSPGTAAEFGSFSPTAIKANILVRPSVVGFRSRSPSLETQVIRCLGIDATPDRLWTPRTVAPSPPISQA